MPRPSYTIPTPSRCLLWAQRRMSLAQAALDAKTSNQYLATRKGLQAIADAQEVKAWGWLFYAEVLKDELKDE